VQSELANINFAEAQGAVATHEQVRSRWLQANHLGDLPAGGQGAPVWPGPSPVLQGLFDRYCRRVSDPGKWVIHGERLVDDTPHVRVSVADVELPNHVRFTQYVFRMRPVAVTVVVDDAWERVLMMRRHRFIVDRWVCELPGGYVDDGEDPAAAAAREVEEETGWRPRRLERVLSCQPLIGNADYPQDLHLARGADLAGAPEADETAEVAWIALDDTPAMIASGQILGAVTVIGVQHALLRRAAARGPRP
jgi:8-oxo-dGTP pyrophosphatase MutT (NUDIX family)